jgi:hypothetical protein
MFVVMRAALKSPGNLQSQRFEKNFAHRVIPGGFAGAKDKFMRRGSRAPETQRPEILLPRRFGNVCPLALAAKLFHAKSMEALRGLGDFVPPNVCQGISS